LLLAGADVKRAVADRRRSRCLCPRATGVLPQG